MDESQIRSRDVKFSERFGAILHDWELAFDKENYSTLGAGFANIHPKPGSVVEGILYKTDSIEQLDRREGYPEHYDRKILGVKSHKGEVFECIVYVANPDKVKEGLKPTRVYLDHLLEGEKFLSGDYFRRLCRTEVVA